MLGSARAAWRRDDAGGRSRGAGPGPPISPAGDAGRAPAGRAAFIRGATVPDRGQVGDGQVAAACRGARRRSVALAGGPRGRGTRRSRDGARPGRAAAAHRRRMARAGARRQTAAPRWVARRRRARSRGAAAPARTGRTRSVHGRIRSGSRIWRSRPAASASRDMRMRSAVSSTTSQLVGLADERRHDLDAGRAGELERLEDVVGAALVRADEADARAGGRPAISWTSSR